MIYCITGLPRSGTAFVSSLLNLNPEVIAYHELAAYDRNWRYTLSQPRINYSIVCDCNTYGFVTDFAYNKCVYIDYDPVKSAQAAQAALQMQMDPEKFIELEKQAWEWSEKNSALIISRNEIFTLDGQWKLWTYLFQGRRFPYTKIKEMCKLNIQHHNASEIFSNRALEL